MELESNSESSGLVVHWLHTAELGRDQVESLVVGNLSAAALSALRVDPSIELRACAVDAFLADSPGIGTLLGHNAGSTDV